MLLGNIILHKCTSYVLVLHVGYITITLHMAVSKGVAVTATVVKQWPKSLSIVIICSNVFYLHVFQLLDHNDIFYKNFALNHVITVLRLIRI